MLRWLIVVSLTLVGCPTVKEQAPCDKASLAVIVAGCKNPDDCNQRIEAREKECGERIIVEYEDAGVAGSTGGKSQ